MGSGQPLQGGGSSGEQQNPPGNTRGCNSKRCCREGIVQWDFWGEVQQGEGELRLQSSSAQGQGMGLTPPGKLNPAPSKCLGGTNPESPKANPRPWGLAQTFPLKDNCDSISPAASLGAGIQD